MVRDRKTLSGRGGRGGSIQKKRDKKLKGAGGTRCERPASKGRFLDIRGVPSKTERTNHDKKTNGLRTDFTKQEGEGF